MDLSSDVPDLSGAEPGTLLLLVGVLVVLAAGRTVVVLARLVGLLVRSIAQLLRSLVLLLICLGLITAWGCHRIEVADTSVIAPAASPTPTLGPPAKHT
jgi:hypothetical protein